uniref:putative C-type lectin domain family 20 member A isoform X2 n=1 Tax=Scatophagus argus TaxID=75038 RepID=UPI001ED861A9|nr:putative C-type lectin domain family 20 member A isoform X2 [Scatophagus argus]
MFCYHLTVTSKHAETLHTMDTITSVFMVLSGLYILPSYFLQVYQVVKDAKTWTEAQRYCREKYKDLAAINSDEDMIRLIHMLQSGDEVWIGLYGDINNWKWSLEREGFYKTGEAEFRMWNSGEPNVYSEPIHFPGPAVCGDVDHLGQWSDFWCSGQRPFVCYNESSGTRYIYVNTSMNWFSAQSYCREHYTDLASVRNRNESLEIGLLVEVAKYAWIGLYREPWKWSDGQPTNMTSFSNWKDNQAHDILHSCVTSTGTKWNSRLCSTRYAFVCSASTVRQQVVKVVLKKSDSSVDLKEMEDAILQQFSQGLNNHGLDGSVRLKWIKQPDGEIFHLKETEEEN